MEITNGCCEHCLKVNKFIRTNCTKNFLTVQCFHKPEDVTEKLKLKPGKLEQRNLEDLMIVPFMNIPTYERNTQTNVKKKELCRPS